MPLRGFACRRWSNDAFPPAAGSPPRRSWPPPARRPSPPARAEDAGDQEGHRRPAQPGHRPGDHRGAEAGRREGPRLARQPPDRRARRASRTGAATPATPASPPWAAWPSWRPATSPAAASTARKSSTCLDFVLASCQQSGLIASDASQGPMYGHGFATLFLGEVYGMTGNEEVKEKLQKAVQLIEKTQNQRGRLALPARPLRRRHQRHHLPGDGPACRPRRGHQGREGSHRQVHPVRDAAARTPTAASATWPARAAAAASPAPPPASPPSTTPASSKATTSSAA